MMERLSSTFSYAVFRFVKDAKRDLSVPVGVALWSRDLSWVGVRFIRREERLPGVNKNSDFPYVEFVERKIQSWLSSNSLPYQREGVATTTDAWWNHLRQLLVHKVKVSEPRPIDCVSPDQEIEGLFRDVVRGVQNQDGG